MSSLRTLKPSLFSLYGYDNIITDINHTIDYITEKDEKTKRNSPIEAEHIPLEAQFWPTILLDHDRDKINGRATMPIVFGIKKAVNFYYFLEYMPYVAIILSVIFRFAPICTILTLGTFPWVKKNVDKFVANPDKQKTFMTSILNFHIMVATEIVTMFIGFLLHF